MKKIYKIITLIMIILILLFCMNTRVSAIGEIIEDGQSFLGAADPGTVNVSIGAIEGASGYLYNILLSAGIVIAVIIATVLGVQFMLSEAEGQAKVKEMLSFKAIVLPSASGSGPWCLTKYMILYFLISLYISL